jgi:hypothetical protein
MELVVKDELKDYLNSDAYCEHSLDSLSKIRSIVRKEVIDGLKFPTYEAYKMQFLVEGQTTTEDYNWFTNEIKRLNS